MATLITAIRRKYEKDQGSGLVTLIDSCLTECDSVCIFDFADSGGITATSNYLAAVYDIGANPGDPNGFCATSDRTVYIAYNGFGTIGNEFILYVDGEVAWSSGCITGSGADSALIPAGSTRLTLLVYGACNTGGGDLWSFTLTC